MQLDKQLEQSDEGQQVNRLMQSLEINHAIEKLPDKDKNIIKMIMSGYKQNEIIEKLKTNYPYVKRLLKLLKDKIS